MDNICIDCRKSADCKRKPRTDQWTVAGCSWFEADTVITNADRIRGMTDTELAKWFCSDRECDTQHCPYCKMDGCHIEEWLKAPAEEDE